LGDFHDGICADPSRNFMISATSSNDFWQKILMVILEQHEVSIILCLTMKLNPKKALATLSEDQLFKEVFSHGTLEVEIYQPKITDNQQPHERDEVYFIISGHGMFEYEGETTDFEPGDCFFVPAGDEHRFMNFSDDFAVWVLFYGPRGGEK
jgi:mannose-6-phosphate isomerase-like protein (cupin superfamily)